MLKPLQQWICDTCNQIIQSPNDGCIEWLSDDNCIQYGFKIIHNATCSPKYPPSSCYQYIDIPHQADAPLEYFVGPKGVAYLLSFLDVGPYHDPNFSGPWVKDVREFIEFMRRLTLPFYEEARLYWHNALEEGYFGDANEISVYLPETLESLIAKYSHDRI